MKNASLAILAIFVKSAVVAGGSLTRVDLLSRFPLGEDDFEDGIEELLMIDFVDTRDQKHGPFILTVCGYDSAYGDD